MLRFVASKKKLSFVLFAICSLVLIQCGGSSGGNNNPVNPPTPPPVTPQGPVAVGNRMQLYLFSAPWCENCNKEIPDIKARLGNLTANQQQRIDVTINVVTGNAQTDPATQPVAEAYGKKLGVDFKMVADKNFKIYRKYYEDGNLIPAAVVLDGDSKMVKVYDPGKMEGPALDEMLNLLTSNLK